MNNDEYYMHLAIKLARKGNGYVSPNPLVGAVIVKNGRIIGQGYHKQYGGPHAEVNAIKNASEDATGATLYVTLEPCCHTGKTPPCVESIVANKFRKVVVGTIDANPLVSRKGLNYLQSRGIEVAAGVLEDECRRLNEVFFHYMETGMPFVTVKYAETFDGRIATANGQSQWISSPASLKFAHQLRARHDAILVGAQTVIKDNPELTVRHIRGRNPLRIVVDSSLKVPLQAKVFQDISAAGTLIATTKTADDPKCQSIADYGSQMISTDADGEGRVDLKKLFKILAARGISSILVEGGSQIITSVLKDNLASRLVTIIAPKIIGKG
ncbi:MAG: bifunctional diaminohydroxyphosphoribosylaminopyrimidine deaminase/5-amino-6-(5-phosphoribosylamino)uracil reductase RibD, partial [Syntrophaceae bacterium]|nr:bifunctional diaminohydroxyphosphoribosylaminopyrimidine deaminase/5-amino-6-(5-phosphoribosylamino)uracil reductase RibD [Syntrophaceae bacterium]